MLKRFGQITTFALALLALSLPAAHADQLSDILEAGKINEKDEAFYVEDFQLQADERLVGVKSQMNEKGTARHWNLQFTIGAK